MFTMVNWCSAVVQGTIQSCVTLGFPSPPISPMANSGEWPKFLRWSHGESLSKSARIPALRLETSLCAALAQHHAVAGQ